MTDINMPVAWTHRLQMEQLKSTPKESAAVWGEPNGTICIPLYAVPANTEPVAWLHTLHMEFDQKIRRLSFDDDNAFGVPGRDYSEEYEVTIEPLFSQARKETP